MGNRRFVPMEAALRHWLGPYRKKEGLLVPLVDSAVRRRMKKLCVHSKKICPIMRFVIRMLRIGWRVQAKRDWMSFPNEWAILRPSAKGIIWKHSLEKKGRVGLGFGAPKSWLRDELIDAQIPNKFKAVDWVFPANYVSD